MHISVLTTTFIGVNANFFSANFRAKKEEPATDEKPVAGKCILKGIIVRLKLPVPLRFLRLYRAYILPCHGVSPCPHTLPSTL